MFWRESEGAGAGGAAAGWSGACDCMCVCESQRVCVCASWACTFANACSFCPASCFLMQQRTVSPGLLGDLVMFFFLPVLAGNENQLLCCCHRSGEVCFPFTFIHGTSPSTVTVETRATPTLFPSMSPSFNDLSSLSFFNPLHSTYLPTLVAANEVFRKPCDISEEDLYISRDRELKKHMLRNIWFSATWTFWALSECKACQDCKVTRLNFCVFAE